MRTRFSVFTCQPFWKTLKNVRTHSMGSLIMNQPRHVHSLCMGYSTMQIPALTRREREIMEIIFASQRATVHQICSSLSERPTPMAVRRMLAILLEKGHLKREKLGREFVYLPIQSKQRAGLKALRQVLATFFDGSIGSALATHFDKPGKKLTDQEVQQLSELIDHLKQKRDHS